MRLLAYSVASFALAAATISHAYITHNHQFYPAAIHLSHSNASVLAMMNMVLVCAVLFGTLVKNVFIGPLRVIEQEHLYERLWFSISESCLAMTIFREDFSTQFVLYFTFLLMAKTFHWLALDRVEYMEQAPNVRTSFHIRMSSLMVILAIIDVYMVSYSVQQTYALGPSMMIMFGFEFMILATSIVCTFCKYLLYTVDHQTEAPWEEKSMYIFYLELMADFVKLITYTCFFTIILSHYGLPLHIIRDLYMTLQNFISRLRSFVQYRRAMVHMNGRYPDATEADLQQSDRTCIICREDMDVASNQPKKLPCGHIFHFRCLRSWLERQQTCPTCRRSVLQLSADNLAPTPPVNLPRHDDAHVLPNAPHHPPALAGHNAAPHQNTRTPNTPPHVNQPHGTVPHVPGFRLIPLFSGHGVPALSSSSSGASSSTSTTHRRLFPMSQALPLLSDEQLRQLEGIERAKIEERIRLLVGLQEEVSSVVGRLQQYLELVNQDMAESVGQAVQKTEGDRAAPHP